MAENTQTFILVGKFDDQITPALKKLNRTFGALERSLSRGIKRPFKELNKDLREFGKESKAMGRVFDRNLGRGIDRFRNGLKAANEDAKQLGSSIRHAAQAGDGMGNNLRAGLRGAQEDARVLGDILKANALIKTGEAFANSMEAGARGTLKILSKGTGFIQKQFSGAVEDQLQDIQARGALFGSLNKSKLFGEGPGAGASAEQREEFVNQGYKQAKNVNRAMEKAIGDVVRTSTVSTTTITTLSRQLNDNLLPTLLKAKGITDISGLSRDDLDKLMGGEKGIGRELATLYEQIGSVVPSASYAPQAARAVSEFLGKGKVNRQLAIFEQNPVLVEALEENVKKYGNTMEGRIRALKEAFEVAMPQAALAEARNSIAGGLQSIGDSLTNQSVGIFSMGADIANQGEKTLELMKKSGVYQASIDTFTRRQDEVIKSMKAKNKTEAEISKVLKQQEKDLKKYKDGLEDLYTSADSPIEILGATLGPTLQAFANLISEFGNVFIGPVTAIVETIGPSLTKLQDNFDNLASEIRSGKISPAEALGRAVGEIFKALAVLFDPEGLIKEGDSALQKMYADFMKGFESIDGSKWLNQILSGLQDIIMKILFKDGNITDPTAFTKALAGVFAVFALPSFISGLVAGLVPLAIQAMGSMMLKVFASEKLLTGLMGLLAKGKAPAVAAAALGSDALLSGGGAAVTSGFMGSEALLAGGGSAAATTAGTAGTGGASATGIAALMTNPVTIAAAAVAALAVVAKITEPVVNAVAPKVQKMAEAQTAQAGKQAKAGDIGSMFAYFIKGEFMHVANDFVIGFNRVFSGLADLVVGLFSDPKKVTEGINKIFEGLWRLFTMCGHLIIGLLASLPGFIVLLGNAIKNLFMGIWGAITQAWDKRPKWMGGTGGEPPAAGTKATLNGKPVVADGKGGWKAAAFGSPGVKFTSLDKAIGYEMENKPPGSDLVIANSSETIIPAASGYGDGVKGMIDAIWRSANEVASTTAKGFDVLLKTTATGDTKIAAVTAQTGAQTKAAIDRSVAVQMAESAKLMSAIKAASAFGGFGGGGMALGSGYGSKGVQIAGALGNFIKQTGGAPGSIWEHPMHGGVKGKHAPGSYHYSGRAIDIGAYANEQAGVIARIKQFNAQNGVKPVEFLHAGNDPNHQDHVHVAYAHGINNPRLFTSAKAAAAYEGMMAPAGARVSTITANSSEGFGSTTNVTQNITISGAEDPRRLAEMVFNYAAQAAEHVNNSSFA